MVNGKYSESDGRSFLKFARSVIESKFFSVEKIDVSKYSSMWGVFVTLIKDGELRGCIGYPYPVHPLNIALEKAARSAAFSDSRFPPVLAGELSSISYEISILTLPEEIIVDDKRHLPDMIEIGRDGLIVDIDGISGLLLPIVAVEWGFNSKAFLEQVCLKAGLPKDSWLRKDCKISSFETQVFND